MIPALVQRTVRGVLIGGATLALLFWAPAWVLVALLLAVAALA